MLRTMISFVGKQLYLRFLDLVNLLLIATWDSLNSQFYQQTDATAMGGPASSVAPARSMALHPPKVWDQFVHDVHLFMICSIHSY